MKPRHFIILALLGLGAGFLISRNRSPEVAASVSEPTPGLAAGLSAKQDRVLQLEKDLAAARQKTSAQSATPAVAAPTAAEPGAGPAEAGSRLQAAQLLKAQGATVRVSVFGGRTPTSLGTAAKKFFNLTDDEAARVEAAFANAQRDVNGWAALEATAAVTAPNTLTVTVPAAENSRDLRARVLADLTAAVGPERAQEFMEIGTADLDRVLRSYGSTERTVVITRVLPPPNAPPGVNIGQYRLTERVANGSMGTNFNNPAEKEEFSWLSKFTPDLESLTATTR